MKVPEMGQEADPMKRGQEKNLRMKERRVLVKAFAEEYQRAGRKKKGEISNRFVAATG